MHLDNYKRVNRTLELAVDFIRDNVVNQTQAWLRAEPELDLPYIVVHLSNTFWPFHLLGCVELYCIQLHVYISLAHELFFAASLGHLYRTEECFVWAPDRVSSRGNLSPDQSRAHTAVLYIEMCHVWLQRLCFEATEYPCVYQLYL